jgi:cell division protein FtsQ
MNHSLPVPVDVKLMNVTTSLLVAALALGCVAAGLWWFARHPAFAIRHITVGGDTAHNSAASLRASVGPRLSGNFFTMDLPAAQSAFQAAPWVRRALVRREFPGQLHVQLQEHVPVAHWGDDAHMVNNFGEVFEAGGGADDEDDLPTLLGPDGHAAEVLGMYRLLAPLAAPLGVALDELALQARGNWRVELASGAQIELGQGSPEELAARFRQFVATAREVAARHQRPVAAIEAADLRHVGGYALRMRGVSTVRADTPGKPAARTAATR